MSKKQRFDTFIDNTIKKAQEYCGKYYGKFKKRKFEKRNLLKISENETKKRLEGEKLGRILDKLEKYHPIPIIDNFLKMCGWDSYNEEFVMSNLCNVLYAGLMVVTASSIVGLGVLKINAINRASNPRPPIYRDVNGNGIEDKIIQRGVPGGGLFGPSARLEEEVLYGVDIDGKRIYLPQEQFNGLER